MSTLRGSTLHIFDSIKNIYTFRALTLISGKVRWQK